MSNVYSAYVYILEYSTNVIDDIKSQFAIMSAFSARVMTVPLCIR